jgi:hypothetical protein
LNEKTSPHFSFICVAGMENHNSTIFLRIAPGIIKDSCVFPKI